MKRLGITMPTRTVALDRVAEYAQWADEAGFDSVWDYELYRNPFSMLCLCAVNTERSLLATGLAAGFPLAVQASGRRHRMLWIAGPSVRRQESIRRSHCRQSRTRPQLQLVSPGRQSDSRAQG